MCLSIFLYLDKSRLTHHGNVISCLLEFVFDTASDVSKVRQRELFKLGWPQNAGVGLEHLQSLDGTDTAEDRVSLFKTCNDGFLGPLVAANINIRLVKLTES